MSDDLEFIPAAAIWIPGEAGNKAYFDLSTDDGWKMLRSEITEAFQPSEGITPSGKAFPERMHGYDVALVAMTRGEFNRLPEHGGW